MGKKKTYPKRTVSKKIGGKTYYYAGESYKKSEAQAKAKRIRKHGHSARVLKGYKPKPPRKGIRYYVYEEKHKR